MDDAGASCALERLSAKTGVAFPELFRARERTEERLRKLRQEATALTHDEDVCLVLCGSSARKEVTDESDDDWLILATGAKRDSLIPSDDEVLEFMDEKRKPGKQGIFGTHAFCSDLAGKIGLDPDDNTNLTRRVLMILESVPLSNDDAHRLCWTKILDGYLEESTRWKRPPRFFLNDVVRYWRTICVDFVGKQRNDNAKWGTRNAKLRTSRKVLFAGGLLPLLQCFQFDRDEARSFLVDQLSAPATDRLAYAFMRWGISDTGARFMETYDRWVGMLGQQGVRAELDSIESPAEAQGSETFEEIREIAKEVDLQLLTLLFGTDLEPISRQYGIF
jgi:hypothetical protein